MISAFNSRLKKIEKPEAELAGVKKEMQDMHLRRTPSAAPTLPQDVHVSSEAAVVEGLFKRFGDGTLKKISVPSGSEKSRLAMAVIMLSRPNCLIMDEPTNHMDIYTGRTMSALFAEFKGTVIAVSHDRQYLK
jgi:ATP-binding cassette subfamily F protein 3